MGKYYDFSVRYDEGIDTQDDLIKRILYSLVLRRIKGHKPTVMFIGADSGEGKSFAALRLSEILLELQELNPMDYINDINIYTPLEYPDKINKLLGLSSNKDENERLKKCNIAIVHEARDLVSGKNWNSFINQAIADVNAMSRSVKRLTFIIISQFIRDIDRTQRYTLNYYFTVKRPLGKKARLYMNVVYKDDKDLEKPRLRKRKVQGFIVDSEGRKRVFVPDYLELSKPNKEIVNIFEASDREAKAERIRDKMEQLVNSMRSDMGIDKDRTSDIVGYYMNNQEVMHTIGKTIRGKFKLNGNIKKMYDLTDIEVKLIQRKLNEAMKNTEMIEETLEVEDE